MIILKHTDKPKTYFEYEKETLRELEELKVVITRLAPTDKYHDSVLKRIQYLTKKSFTY